MDALTPAEVQALSAILEDAIVKSKEEDDGDPVYHDVHVEGVNPFGDALLLEQVHDSLAKKGLIECSGTLDDDFNEVPEFVCITPAGLEALKSAKGVH